MSTVIALGNARFEVELLIDPARDKNHDRILVRDGFVAVADGSTPLVEREDIDAGRFAERTLEALYQHRTAPTACSLVKESAMEVGHSSRPLTEVATCAFCLLRVVDALLEVIIVGDCLAVWRTRAGQVAFIRDTRLAELDRAASRTHAQLIATGASREEAWSIVLPNLHRNRLAANHVGGYWVFSGDPRVAKHLLTRLLPLGELEVMLVCSDGLVRLIDPFRHVEGPAALLSEAEEIGLDALVGTLRALENAPGSVVTYPRLDIHDDVSATLLRRYP